jgi:hypothetical protein
MTGVFSTSAGSWPGVRPREWTSLGSASSSDRTFGQGWGGGRAGWGGGFVKVAVEIERVGRVWGCLKGQKGLGAHGAKGNPPQREPAAAAPGGAAPSAPWPPARGRPWRGERGEAAGRGVRGESGRPAGGAGEPCGQTPLRRQWCPTCRRPGSSPRVLSHSSSCPPGSCSQRSSLKLGDSTAGRGRCHAGWKPSNVSPAAALRTAAAPARRRRSAASGRGASLSPAASGGSAGSSRLTAAARKLLAPSRLTGDLAGAGAAQSRSVRPTRAAGGPHHSCPPRKPRATRPRQPSGLHPPNKPRPSLPQAPAAHSARYSRSRAATSGAGTAGSAAADSSNVCRDRCATPASPPPCSSCSSRHRSGAGAAASAAPWGAWVGEAAGGRSGPVGQSSRQRSAAAAVRSRPAAAPAPMPPHAAALAPCAEGPAGLTRMKNETKGLAASLAPLNASHRTNHSARRCGVLRRALSCGGGGGGGGGRAAGR